MSWGAALVSRIVGLAVGWLAAVVMGVGRYGRGADLMGGLFGGVLGDWGFRAIGVSDGGLLGTSIAAFVGAGASIAAVRMVRPASA